MASRIEFAKVAPMPIQRAVNLAAWYWPADPRRSIEAMSDAFRKVALAQRTPGYPQDHLSRDEEASLKTLCEMLDSEHICSDQMSADDKARLKNLALRKITEIESQDPGRAFQIAHKAQQFFPDDLALTERLGNMYFHYERYVSAKPLYRQILEAHPERIALARRLHKCYLETGMNKRAQMLSKHYMREYPDDKNTLMMAGYQALHKGRALDALSYASKVYDNFDEYPGAMLLKALAFSKLGKEDDANLWFDAHSQAEAETAQQRFTPSARTLS